MTHLNRVLGFVLLLFGSGASLAAQSQDSLDKSFVSVMATISPSRSESGRALLISEKGLVVTTWRNVCVQGNITCSLYGMSTSAKVIGVHPNRDLALLQLDLSKANPQYSQKPARMAKGPVSAGDQIFLFQSGQPVPGIVSSDTQPVGNPEYFWVTGRDPKAGAPWPGGWGGSQPRPDDWISNLQGEVQGVVARVIVNGKMTLRVIPVHDVKPEDFVAPARRRINYQKAQDLIQLADGLEKDLQKNRYRPIPFGTYEPDVMDYLRLALAEDPTNKDLNFRLGVIRDASAANSAPEARKLPDPTLGKSDEQVHDEFMRSRLALAVEHKNSGRVKLAQGILEDIIATSPKSPEARVAQRLLDSMKDQK
ncbi:MAG TPA: hypothetical protein VNM14_16425 [Planctomycetota bacterium]|jgi:hypothetical protein|nr:hypothetical protein [Planctomycetota bacterium]